MTNLHSAAEAGAADAGCLGARYRAMEHRSTTMIDALEIEASIADRRPKLGQNRGSDPRGIGADRSVWCWPSPDETCNLIRSPRGNSFTDDLPMPDRRNFNRKRLTIDMSDDEHRMLKTFAAAAGVTIRVLVTETLRREGLLTRPTDEGVQYLLGS